MEQASTLEDGGKLARTCFVHIVVISSKNTRAINRTKSNREKILQVFNYSAIRLSVLHNVQLVDTLYK